MRYLFYLGHPAHFHLFKHTIAALKAAGHPTCILIKKKDVLEELLSGSGWDYTNILPNGRGDDLLSMARGLLNRDWRLFSRVLSFKPTLMIGTSAEITHIGHFFDIPSIVVNEDDVAAVPLFARLAYPLASAILAPRCCDVGRWSSKKISYDGYHELAYLHPNRFQPDPACVRSLIGRDSGYFMIRFAKLTAHHDAGVHGISGAIAARIIERLEPHGPVFITSERELEPEFEKYRLAADPAQIHHFLSCAELLVSDSQTITAEAAVLGTPSIRCNDFVGRIGYLHELEHRYELSYGFRPSEYGQLLSKLDQLLARFDLRMEWHKRRRILLGEKIDVTRFFLWLFENHPASLQWLRKQPQIAFRFAPRSSAPGSRTESPVPAKSARNAA